MLTTRLLAVSLAVASAACGARYRPEVLGSARVTAGTGGPPPAVAVEHAPDRHDVAVSFYLPRAMVVAYTVRCPGNAFEGTVGETWEQYRERRLAELRAERQRQVNAVGALVGAAVGSAGARGAVATPAGTAEAEAEVDGEAAGRAVADSAIADVELPPGDVGAQHHARSFQLYPADAGQCALELTTGTEGVAIDGVVADLTVTRFVDLSAERAAARARANAVAVDLRATISADLVARGADPHKRQREREAQARAEAERHRERYELELRLRAERREAELRLQAERREVELRLQAERRERRLRAEAEHRRRVEAALTVRGGIVATLIASGCDPHKRRLEREAAARAEAERRYREREAARLAYEAKLRAEQERRLQAERVYRGALAVRGRLTGMLIGAGADPDYRRKRDEAELRAFHERAERERAERLAIEADIRAATDAALRVRAELKLDLVATGAVDRPPRPAPPMLQAPPRPAPSAVWVEGYYAWSGVAWEWQSGYWSEPPARGAVWIPAVEVVIEGAAVLRPGGWHDRKSGKRVRTRDHRSANDR